MQTLTGRGIDVDAIPIQDELQGVTPSETIISVAPVRSGPNVEVISSEGTTLSPQQKQESRFATFYDDVEDGVEPSREAYNARIPPELGGFLRT